MHTFILIVELWLLLDCLCLEVLAREMALAVESPEL